MGFEDESGAGQDEIENLNAQVEANRQESEKLQATNKKRIELINLISAVVDEKNKPIIENLKEHGDKLTEFDKSFQFIVGKLNEVTVKLDQHSAIMAAQFQINPDVTTPVLEQASTGDPKLDSLMKLSNLANSPLVDKILNRIWPDHQAPQGIQPLISTEEINKRMTDAFMDDLDTGVSIRKFISDTLKKKATQIVVKQSLGNLGKVETHEPAD